MPLPSTLGKYQIEREVGRGGFAVVYQAHDPSLGRRVALKVPHAWLLTDPKFVERFHREARLAANLNHSHIVTIYEIGEERGTPYISMEWLEGMPLDRWLAEVKPPPQAVLQALLGVGAALDYAHGRGVVHRDIKPSNIMVTAHRGGVLTDFGIAKLLAQATQSTSGVIGTPNYLAPELLKGQPATAATDIYALGVMVYQILTGRLPFEGDTPHAVAYQHANEPPPDPRRFNPSLPPPTAALLLQALAKDPRQRPASAVGLIQGLLTNQAPIAGKPTRTPPPLRPSSPRRLWRLWLAGALILLVIGQLAWWALHRSPPVVALATATPVPATIAPIPAPAATATPLPPTETPVPATETTPRPAGDMVFVPAGSFLMGSAASDSQAWHDERPQHTVYLDAFWIDKTELTNAQYQRCVSAGFCTAPAYANDSVYNGASQPVVGVSWTDARTYCGWAGRRLPTEAEWEKAARGTDGRIYPWGNTFSGSRLNYCDQNCADDGKDTGSNDGYALTAPVGSYPAGASPYGALDMAGNVWEWVADWYQDDYYASSPATNPTGPATGDSRVLRGGSWLNNPGGVRSANRVRDLPAYRRVDFGFRCARSAMVILSTPVPPMDTPIPSTPTPIFGIGSTVVSEKDGMELVYVPAGSFLMGSAASDSQAEDDERPQHNVYLDAFWIDKTEVTNAQYQRCVSAGACQQSNSSQDAANQPVTGVSWYGAYAYCEWAGRRLPTEAEWEKAARGADGRIYPWGNQAPACDLANFYVCAGRPVGVGIYPAGASPYGALDMAGNAWEWVADRYQGDYYASSPATNPTGPATGDSRVLRGGSWLNNPGGVRSAFRSWSSPADGVAGFRCARSP